MTKRQIRKAAYQAIFKEGKSHSDTFLELRSKTKMDGNTLADIISGIPSRNTFESTKTVWMSYVGILGLIVLLRLLYVVLVMQQLNPELAVIVIVPIVLLSIFVPAGGIFAAFTARRHMLPGVAIFLSLGILRGLQHSNFRVGWDSYIVFGLVAALIALTLLLMSKWKTPYTKKVEVVSTEQGDKKELRYHFEEANHSNSQVLDDI